jgi:hypothetical protein
MKNTILIISQPDDAHIPFVTRHLTQPVIVLDPSDIIRGQSLSYHHDGTKLHILHNGRELKNIQSIWFRKPLAVWASELPVAPEYRNYSESAIHMHMRELYGHFRDAFWMSAYYAIRQADFKGVQMEQAAALGFLIPETLMTSDAQAAQAFVAEHHATIIKSSAITFPELPGGKPSMFYSRRVKRGQRLDFSGLHLAPALLQQALEVSFELRITVVEQQVFAAAIHAPDIDTSTGSRDWRPGFFDDSVHFEPFKLPEKLEQQCRDLVQNLGLAYGAIDLLCDKHGKFWFLEINPNGQWAFIEQKTELKIGQAIAVSLSKQRNI